MQSNGMEIEAALNIAVSGAQRAGKASFAKSLIDYHQQRGSRKVTGTTNIYAYGVMLNNSTWFEAEEILQEMRAKGIHPTPVIKNIVMSVYTKARMMKKAELIFDDMKRNGEADVISFTQMVKAFIRNDEVERAQTVWDEMWEHGVEPNVVAYTTLISELEKRGEHTKALRVYDVMKEAKVRPNAITYATLIQACGKAVIPDLADRLYAEMREAREAPNIVVFQNLLWAMSKSGRWARCKYYFEEIKLAKLVPDPIAWNTYIYACAKFGSLGETKEIFAEMRRRLGTVTDAACVAILIAHARAGLVDEALNLMATFSDRNYLKPSTKTLNTVINACVKGSDEHKFDKALKLFRFMKDSGLPGIEPDAVTYNTLMQAFNRIQSPQMAIDLFSKMSKNNVLPDIETALTLMLCLGNLGRVDDALRVLKTLRVLGREAGRDGTVSSAYAAMIDIYYKARDYDEIVSLYEEMVQDGGAKVSLSMYEKVLYAAARLGRTALVASAMSGVEEDTVDPGAAAYEAVIRGYVAGGSSPGLALEIYDAMLAQGVRPSGRATEIEVLLRAAGRADEIEGLRACADAELGSRGNHSTTAIREIRAE